MNYYFCMVFMATIVSAMESSGGSFSAPNSPIADKYKYDRATLLAIGEATKNGLNKSSDSLKVNLVAFKYNPSNRTHSNIIALSHAKK